MNNGKLFSRCDYLDDEGNVNADNCELPDDEPLNSSDIFRNNDLIDAVGVKYKMEGNAGVKCTVCVDPENDDFNILLIDDSNTTIEVSSDLDHIFVQNGYCQNFEKVVFQRDFLDKIVEYKDDSVPASDHYAVTLDIEFKKNGGGGCDKGKCLKKYKGEKKNKKIKKGNLINKS